MSNETKKPVNRPSSRNKIDKDVGGQYNTMVQSLLDIWNVLATASKPITAKEVGERLRNRKTSPPTAERRLSDSVDLINTVFPHTVLHEEGKPPILHTYPYNGALHVVVEDSFGKPLWTGDMTAVFQESSINPIPQSTLNRKLPEMMEDFDDMKLAVKKKKQADSGGKNAPKDPRASEDALFEEGYPPLSLAAIVETKALNGKREKKVVLSCLEYEEQQKKLPPDKKNTKSPTRKFYLESILSPEEWQILSDMILVYPYISEQETDKLISAMRRMAPGSRKWHKLVHAKKTPNAIRFDFIRKLENAIQHNYKVGIEYGRYQLSRHLYGWKPSLQSDGSGFYAVCPYALTWSNGYYYLVGSVEQKDENRNILRTMRNFRLDRILQIMPTTEAFEKPADFDVYQYRDRSPVMYPGQAVPITLRCHVSMLSILMDFFGTAISRYSAPENDYTTITLEASENGTKLFAMQYADRVEVLEPQSLRDDVAATLQAAADNYT